MLSWAFVSQNVLNQPIRASHRVSIKQCANQISCATGCWVWKRKRHSIKGPPWKEGSKRLQGLASWYTKLPMLHSDLKNSPKRKSATAWTYCLDPLSAPQISSWKRQHIDNTLAHAPFVTTALPQPRAALPEPARSRTESSSHHCSTAKPQSCTQQTPVNHIPTTERFRKSLTSSDTLR